MAAGGTSEHVATLHAKITEAWNCLNSIWVKFGYDEDNFSRRQNAVVKHVSELLVEMVQEADERLNEQQQKLDALMVEIMQLAKDLSIEQVPELDAASGRTLLEMERVFFEIAEGLRKRKAIRMEKYNGINDRLVVVCDEIDETPFKIEFEGIPADSQVAKLEQHLVLMHQEKATRIETFNSLRRSIAELFELLEKAPKTDLELLSSTFDEEINTNHPVSNSGIKVLSLNVLQKVEDMFNMLRDILEKHKETGDTCWQKIRDLWSRLEVDPELTEAFTRVHQPISTENWQDVYKPSVVQGLRIELERLEEEKRRNMSLFVNQVREELTNLWLNKCFMASVEVRFTEPNYFCTAFSISDFTADEYTEELLEKHEAEVDFWREFVARNKGIIDAVIKRGHMFAQYKTLDQKSDDPSRLANRGGALLKEEKERKQLEKAIPKMENELKRMCSNFEEGEDDGHGMKTFLVYGRTINEMIEQDWEQFHEEKRLRKEAKKKPEDGKNKTLMTTQMSAPGSSRKRPATPSSAMKGATTPNKRNKTQCVTPGKTIQSPFLHPSAAGSSKRPLGKPPQAKGNNRNNTSQLPYRGGNTSRTRAASRKVLRKSLDKIRGNTSRKSQSDSALSSSSSIANPQQSSLSQPNLQISSVEQLNFSEVIRGHGPVVEAINKQTKTKPSLMPTPLTQTQRSDSKNNLAMGSRTRGTKTPTDAKLTRQASAGKIPLPKKTTGKEQVPPTKNKDTVISPASSYSEFTDHLLCQSTLNSSAMVPIQRQGHGATPTTPTKSGMSFAPAKLPLSDNCF